MNKTKQIDEEDTPPGDEDAETYQATGPKRGGGAVQFLWFVLADREQGDIVFPIADIRRMDLPQNLVKEVACIHFSGAMVTLAGSNLRRVIHRIAMHRCVSVYELRQGQALPAKGEPVIRRIDFRDMTQAVPKVAKAN
jgi:hypothetical protein